MGKTTGGASPSEPFDIIAFLRANEAIEERVAGDASAAEVAAKMGWSWTKARDTLRQMVRAGQATEHTVRAPKGGTMTVYRLIKCEPPGG